MPTAAWQRACSLTSMSSSDDDDTMSLAALKAEVVKKKRVRVIGSVVHTLVPPARKPSRMSVHARVEWSLACV